MKTSDKIRVTNIQRMCFHDGPGIRTTVFLKGCSLHCPWCSNPENISFDMEKYCYEGNEGVYGKDYGPDELYEEIIKDRNFWGCNGGVTFSGGEPLLQIRKLVPLLKKIKDKGISIAIETSLFASGESVLIACEYVDYCIVDIKILDTDICRKVLGGNVATYFDNVRMAYDSGMIKMFRIPLCYEYTYLEDNRIRIKEFLSNYSDIPVQIFGIHKLGEKKYKTLGKLCWNNQEISEEDLAAFGEELRLLGIDAEIVRI